MNPRILYLTNFRFPTERAHGWQVAKMCQALAADGAGVELWHPRRRQPLRELETDPHDYYGLPRSFAVRALPNIDVFRVQRFVPPAFFKLLYSLHSVAWSLFASLRTKRNGQDVCYTRDPLLAFWLTLLRRPTFFECHVIRQRLGMWTLKRLKASASLIGLAALTRAMKEGLEEVGFEPGKVVVLPDAVDLNDFESVPGRDAARRDLGLPLDVPIVGYVGSFTAMGMEKGIEELVTAVGRVQSEPRPYVVCVGGPLDDRDAYMRAADRAGLPRDRLVLRDRVPRGEVAVWMRSCDVVTIPWPRNSFSELYTSPLKMFEYMAAGVPIVASDLRSLRDVLRDGENALLVTPGDPDSLARAIERVLQDPKLAGKLRAAGLRDVRGHTWEARAARVLSFIGVHTEGVRS